NLQQVVVIPAEIGSFTLGKRQLQVNERKKVGADSRNYSLKQRYLISIYSSNPCLEPSRPIPDCLTPPNGAAALETNPVLTPTIPDSSCSATRQQRLTSRL